MGVGNAWGADPDPVLCTFPSPGSITNNSITVNSVTWSIETTVGAGSPSVALTNATYASTSKSSIKFGTSKKIYYSSFSLSTNYFSSYNVSAVNVHYALNGGVATTVTATQGNTTIGSDTYSTGQTWHDATMNTSNGTGGELTISFTTTQAIAIHSIEITYTTGGSQQSSVCATPTFTPAAGSYEGTQSVTIESTESATIYYTTDGSTPSTSSSVYAGAISVSSSQTLKAYAVKEGLENSEVAEAAYTITAGPDVTLDFTSNTGWNFPTSKTLSEGSFTNGGYTIKVAGGASGTGYNFDTDHLFFGKTGAYIELPTFERPIEKIVIVGVSTGSGSVSFNLFQGETPVSTSVTSCKVDQTFEIAALNQKAGVAHFIRLTNDNNARFAKIKVYLGPEPEKYAVTLAAIGGTLTATKGGVAFASGTEVIAGTVLELNATPTGTNINPSSITVSDGENDVTASVLDGTTLTVPAYDITVSATFTPTYAIEAESVTGGSFSWEDNEENANPARVVAGTFIQTSNSPASTHTFTSYDIYKKGDSETKVSHEDGLFEMPAYDVVISGIFTAKPCTQLEKPKNIVANGTSYPYNAVALNWDDVANADHYEVVIKKAGVTVESNLVDASEYACSTTLQANATYTFEIKATAEDDATWCASAVASADFTTEDYPAATLTLSENGEEYPFAGSHKLNDVVTLPSELEGAGCKNKVLVGWSSVAVGETDTKPASNYWDAGTEYTIVSTEDKLYAVFVSQSGGGSTNVEFNVNTYASENSWSDAKAYNAAIDGISFTRGGGGNNGKYYVSDHTWRFYDGGSLTINGIGITGVTSNPSCDFVESDGTYTYNFGSTVKIKSITVAVTTPVSYSSYTTSCEAQLPVLDAPTGLTSGTYYAAQNITLAATNDAAIYYSLDGNDPTVDAQHLYSEPFSLSERAITTIKAIAVKEGFETSEVAEAEYNINLPYNFEDFAALTKVNNKEYAVRGIISQIESLYSGTKLVYDISGNGFTEGQIKCFRGLGKDKETFSAVTDVNVGDNVTVVGTWSTQYNNLNEDNWILEYTARGEATYTIEGDLTATTFNVNETFDNAILENLSVKATYANGYYETVSGAEFSCGDKAKWAANETTLTVIAKLGDDELTRKDFDVTVSSATLVSIALKEDDENYQTKKVYYVGEDFVLPTIIATLSEGEPYEAVATGVSGFNNAQAGVQNVTVSYARAGGEPKTVSYDVTVKAIFGNEAEPHTVAVAKALIEARGNNNDSETDEFMWVRGIVSQANNASSNKQSYYISDNGETTNHLYVYQGQYFADNANFTTTNKLKVGDDVIVKARVQLYKNNQNVFTPELKYSYVTYQLREANFAIEDVAEMEVNITGDLAVADLDVTKDGNGEVTLVSGNEEIATIVDGNIHAVGAGDVTITANLAATANDGSINYKANSTTFNVHVIAERTRYSVTFDANGANSGSAPEAIANQLEGATVTLPECTFSWEKHGFTGWKVINLSASAEIDVENNRFTMPAANVKIQAQWEEIATTHIVFNVNGNTETVPAIDVPQAVEYNIEQVTDGQNGYEFVGWAESEQAEDVKTTIETIDSYTPQAGEASKTLYAVFKRVDEGALKTDVLTAADFAATSTGYIEFSNVQKNSVAKYSGKTAKNGENIQINKKSENGLYSSVSGGVLVSVKVDISSSSTNLGVYGSNSPFATYTGIPSSGTLIGSGFSTTNTVTPTTEYKYVGIASATDGAKQISKITITWQPKTTYYTTAPSAVYAVSYDLGEGAWAENEGCDGANVKAGKTFDICESVPVRDHYKFNGWKVGDNTASGTITIDAATVITANWVPKVESNITYNAGTGTGSDAVVENNEEGAEIVLPSAADKSLNKTGYDFVGWLYNDKLYKAGTIFEMPASAVTFVAQWKKQNSSKMALVTNANQLVNGSQVIFVNQEDAAIAGNSDKETDTYMASEIVSFNEDKSVVTSTGNGIVMTLVQVEGGWAFRYNDKYLAPYSGNRMAWYSNATAWEITFDGENAKIVKGSYAMRYNKASNAKRFAAYGLTGVEPIQLYASLTAITDTENPVAISDLGYVEGDVIVVNSGVELTMDAPSAPASITVKEGATVTISAATEADNLIVENGGKVTISNSTTINDLFIGSTMASGKSGQIDGATNINFEAVGDVYFDLTLGANGTSAQWHAFTVPFPVDALNGVYDLDGNKLTNEVNYAIMDYHGDIRANGDYGWKKYRGILQPGTFYLMTVDGDRTTYRFKKVAGADIVAENTISYVAYQVDEGEYSDQGWNGIGNPTLFYGQININVQVLNPNTYTYEVKTANSTNFVVGTPFFYQASTTSTISMGAVSGSAFYAPKRQAENEIKDVEISFGNEEFKDHLYISAREEATNNYEIGKDLAKMMMTSTPSVAQIYGKAYNTNLCMIDAPLVNDQATYKFTLYAPAAGEYTITAPNMENVDIYLTKDDAIIWNISEDGYTLDMQQGFTTGYGLLLQVKAPEIATDIDNLSGNASCVQKVVINEHVYILRGEKMYDTTGKIVK